MKTKNVKVCNKHGRFNIETGCQECSPYKTTLDFIRSATVVHPAGYDYYGLVVTSKEDDLRIRCKEHGRFNITAGEHLEGTGCPSCSHAEALEVIDSMVKEPSSYSVSLATYEVDPSF